MDKQLTQLMDGMVAHGVPRSQAVALVMSIEHSLNSESYTKEYGEYLREKLIEFVEHAVKQ